MTNIKLTAPNNRYLSLCVSADWLEQNKTGNSFHEHELDGGEN